MIITKGGSTMRPFEELVANTNKGDAESAYELAKFFADHNADPVIVQNQLRKSAHRGYLDAQIALGILGLRCMLVKPGSTIGNHEYYPSQSQGLQWIRNAASSGHVLPQYIVAQCMMRGIGMSKNEDKAEQEIMSLVPRLDEGAVLAVALFFDAIKLRKKWTCKKVFEDVDNILIACA